MSVTAQDLEINQALSDAIAGLLEDEVARSISNVYPEMEAERVQGQYFPHSKELIGFEVAIGRDLVTLEGEVTNISSFVSDFPRKADLIVRAMERRMASEDYGRVPLMGGRQFQFSLLSVRVRPSVQVSHDAESTTTHLGVFMELHLRVQDVSTGRY